MSPYSFDGRWTGLIMRTQNVPSVVAWLRDCLARHKNLRSPVLRLQRNKGTICRNVVKFHLATLTIVCKLAKFPFL